VADILLREINRFMNYLQAAELFKDVIVVIDNDVIFAEYRDHRLRRSQFNTLFGINRYPLDKINVNFTYSAWDALLKSEAYRPYNLIRNK